MISRCANPACFTRFRYLHEGRIFQFEVRSFPVAGVDARGTNSSPRGTEYFWLCDSCALTMTLVHEPDVGVALIPVQRGLGQGVAPGRQLAHSDRQRAASLHSVTIWTQQTSAGDESMKLGDAAGDRFVPRPQGHSRMARTGGRSQVAVGDP